MYLHNSKKEPTFDKCVFVDCLKVNLYITYPNALPLNR